MPLPLSAAILILLCQEPAASSQVFEDARLGVSFTHPADWTIRRDRLFTEVTMPLAEGHQGTVQIFSAVFRQSAAEWQAVLKQVSESMGRTVERQWEEEILGVPILLTQLSYEEGGRPVRSLVGLLYTRSAEKFQFRLVADHALFEQSERAWREAMLTLRPKSGELPGTEEPGTPVTPAPPGRREERVWRRPEPVRGSFRGPVVETLTAGGARFRLYAPAGWTVSGAGDLTHPAFTGRLDVRVHSGSAPAALSQFNAEVREGLPRFQRVSVREDTPPRGTRSGAELATVFRRGAGLSGPLTLGHAVGYCETCWWAATVSWPGTDAPKRNELRLVADLFEVLYVEPAP